MSLRSLTPVMNWPAISLVSVLLVVSLLTATPAKSDLGPASRSVPSAVLVGKGRMTYLGFKVFDAKLYAPNGVYNASGQFALKLTYLRKFKGKDIVASTVKEIKRQGDVSPASLSSWEKQILAIFPNVSPGESLTGVRTANGSTVFYNGGRKIGTISDPAFTRKFFNIWLGNNTRNPSLRAKLVGAGS